MVDMMVEVVEMMVEDIFPLIFLLLSSYFSLSFDFFPSSFLLLLIFLISEEWHKDMEEFWILKRVCNKCEV